LGKQSFLDDLASLDPELYNGLVFLKHYTGNAEDLSLNFTVAVDGVLTFTDVLIIIQQLLNRVWHYQVYRSDAEWQRDASDEGEPVDLHLSDLTLSVEQADQVAE